MAQPRNYILGKGELLAKNEIVKLGFGEGSDPYTFTEQRAFIAPLAGEAAQRIASLPTEACPNDEAVAVLTLHPKFLSKSAYPKQLLESAGLRAVGSKAVKITPRKSHLKEAPRLSLSTEMYVAGRRKKFQEFASAIAHMSAANSSAGDLIKIEGFRVANPAERIRPVTQHDGKDVFFEVILHAGNTHSAEKILLGFQRYVDHLGLKVNLDERLDGHDLSFIPFRSSIEAMQSVAEFSFLRMAREMPHVRQFWPAGSMPSASPPKTVPITLPDVGPLDPKIRVAVFDGGCPDMAELSRWVASKDAGDVQVAMQKGLEHGLAVTSALLFGSLQPGQTATQPFAKVDHYRIVDNQMKGNTQAALYPMLKRIIAVLKDKHYDFVNFSLGPESAIQDDDIDPWTALIDPLLASGRTLATVAVGNDGESDPVLELNRIKPPSDCVNALSVGSCDSIELDWDRAPYSSVGHGRCPGLMKPDGVGFGGHLPKNPFYALAFNTPGRAKPLHGTSFAAPAVLRTAIGVRAQLGPVVSALALKALLIHNCEIGEVHAASEVGWGRFPCDIAKIIMATAGRAHILYQGALDPKKFLRADIPIPKERMPGLVTISATLCFASDTDAQHPATYTRNGLQIFFRKDRFNVPPGKVNPKPDGFFKSGVGMPEQLLRSDAHQWETVRHASKRMRGDSLVNPCFDIHLNPRDEGHDTDGEKVPYAMVVTVDAPRMPDLFERIFSRYRFTLEELRPRFEIQLQV